MRWLPRNLDTLAAATLDHALLTGAALLLALLLAVPLGIFAARRPRLGALVSGGAATLYAIPTLALFALLVPVLGLGFGPALVALTSYAAPVVLRATVAGLRSVPVATRDAAEGVGLSATRRLFAVDLPLALPALLAGLRVAGATVMSAATVAAYINAGGLGTLILSGLDAGHTEKILVGAAAVGALALLLDQALAAVQRRLPATRGLAA